MNLSRPSVSKIFNLQTSNLNTNAIIVVDKTFIHNNIRYIISVMNDC